jgi:hypothetical protein
MSSHRICPDERNKQKSLRVTVSLLLRPTMYETLRQMYEESQGAGGSTGTLENFLVEHLENLAAEHRARLWRLAHPNEGIKSERKAERTGAVYANASSDLEQDKA